MYPQIYSSVVYTRSNFHYKQQQEQQKKVLKFLKYSPEDDRNFESGPKQWQYKQT